MSHVFVTHESPKLDYSPAESWGELKFVTHKDYTPMGALSPFNADLTREIKAVAKNFDSETDFVVISGSPLVTAVWFMALAERGVKRIKVLRWSNRDNQYHPTSLNLEV